MKSFLLYGAVLTCIMASCACSCPNAAQQDTPVSTEVEQRVQLYTYNVSAQEDRILLQHPLSRELVICDYYTFTDDGTLSEDVELCARKLERYGFVRVTDKPRFVNDDMEKSDSVYPYRLYHADDLTPRW